MTAHPESLAAEVWEHAAEIAALRRTQPWATSALVEGMTSIEGVLLIDDIIQSVMVHIEKIGGTTKITGITALNDFTGGADVSRA